jgi:hypothetical protein
MFLSQFGVGNDVWSGILWFIFIMVFFLFYPRIMLSQIMWRLEKSVKDLTEMSDRAKKSIISGIAKKPDRKLKESVDRFFEFFVISPVSLDPVGIIRKIDHVIRNEEDRFDYFVRQVYPSADREKRACIKMGFAAGISLYDVMKIVRHYVELVRKTKNLQIALILQMQLPMIEKIAKSLSKGTHALLKGNPIGDGLGPLVAAKLLGSKNVVEIERDVVMAHTRMHGRNAFIVKAGGPGGRVGFPGKAVEKIVKGNKIAKIITIDAAAKLEGEKTGTLAEGVGVAMGGPGTERYYIEGICVKKNIPIDSIIVKMSSEEAIEPMKKSIKDACPKVLESVKRSIEATKNEGSILIVGVGNSSGVGNSAREAEKTEKWVDHHHRKTETKKKKK